jgi:hypothetical protein
MDCAEIVYCRLLYVRRLFFGVGKAGCSYYDTFFKDITCARRTPYIIYILCLCRYRVTVNNGKWKQT